MVGLSVKNSETYRKYFSQLSRPATLTPWTKNKDGEYELAVGEIFCRFPMNPDNPKSKRMCPIDKHFTKPQTLKKHVLSAHGVDLRKFETGQPNGKAAMEAIMWYGKIMEMSGYGSEEEVDAAEAVLGVTATNPDGSPMAPRTPKKRSENGLLSTPSKKRKVEGDAKAAELASKPAGPGKKYKGTFLPDLKYVQTYYKSIGDEKEKKSHHKCPSCRANSEKSCPPSIMKGDDLETMWQLCIGPCHAMLLFDWSKYVIPSSDPRYTYEHTELLDEKIAAAKPKEATRSSKRGKETAGSVEDGS